jgi:hypothetical protein
MDHLLFKFALAVLFTPAFAQTPPAAVPMRFGLKGDTIGESLSDFRTRNSTTLGEGADARYPRCSGDASGEKPHLQAYVPGGENMTILMNRYHEATRIYRETHDLVQENLDSEAVEAHVLGADRVCLNQRNIGNGNGTIAGFDADVRYYFVNGRLDRISGSFKCANHDSVAKAITAKYGPPTSVQLQTIQNRMGATYPSELRKWTSTTAIILLKERGENIDYSHLDIFDPATAKSLNDERDKKAVDSF